MAFRRIKELILPQHVFFLKDISVWVCGHAKAKTYQIKKKVKKAYLLQVWSDSIIFDFQKLK